VIKATSINARTCTLATCHARYHWYVFLNVFNHLRIVTKRSKKTGHTAQHRRAPSQASARDLCSNPVKSLKCSRALVPFPSPSCACTCVRICAQRRSCHRVICGALLQIYSLPTRCPPQRGALDMCGTARISRLEHIICMNSTSTILNPGLSAA